MDKLPFLKEAIDQTYADMINDRRPALQLAIGGMFNRPLVRFEEAYDAFIMNVVKDSAIYDRWLNVQMQLATRLAGDCEEALIQFVSMFEMVLDQTPGGETATFAEGLFDKKSFIFALAFRVYLDALVANTPMEGDE